MKSPVVLFLACCVVSPALADDTAPIPPEPKPRPEEHEPGSPPTAASTPTGFSFGSYGRVNLGVDGNGHEGYATNVVSHGSRLEEPNYLELDLYYTGAVGGSDARWRVVLAPAFTGSLFHYSGDFSSQIAIRNAYVETEHVGLHGLSFWAGSRMLRGDDIYLFDYWPLDNLNTVGAGSSLRAGHLDLQLHGGLNRLDDPAIYQTEQTPARGLGPPGSALVLDRPRSVLSMKATYRLGTDGSPSGSKISLYGELHHISNGSEINVSQMVTTKLPAETGFVLGGQIGAWLRPYTFANLFVRYATGLGVYGDITQPQTVDLTHSSAAARELVLALSANYETSIVGVMVGGFLRTYSDPSGLDFNNNDYVEGIFAVRPQLYPSRYFHIAAELSYQSRHYSGLDPLLERQLKPAVWRASILPIISPTGAGTYARPIIYAVATVSSLNQDALDTLFTAPDIRYGTSTVLYLGVGAEWWFQSSYR